jgi:large subunit ribosomal protein L5
MSDNVKGAKQPKGGGKADKGGKGKGGAPAAEAVDLMDAPEVPSGPLPMPRMQERYRNEIVPALMKEFGYDNVMQVPRLTKISVNIGLGEAIQNSKAIDAATGDLVLVTGQKPVVTKARLSIAVYKLREGMPIGVMVTLRGRRMWDFLDRLINIVLPRQRDFQGVSPDSFDGRGNYSIGLREQLVFPEIDYDKVDKVRGMEITIVTTAQTDEEARRMLALFDMPFKRA